MDEFMLSITRWFFSWDRSYCTLWVEENTWSYRSNKATRLVVLHMFKSDRASRNDRISETTPSWSQRSGVVGLHTYSSQKFRFLPSKDLLVRSSCRKISFISWIASIVTILTIYRMLATSPYQMLFPNTSEKTQIVIVQKRNASLSSKCDTPSVFSNESIILNSGIQIFSELPMMTSFMEASFYGNLSIRGII